MSTRARRWWVIGLVVAPLLVVVLFGVVVRVANRCGDQVRGCRTTQWSCDLNCRIVMVG